MGITAISTSLPKKMQKAFKDEFKKITGHEPYANDPDIANTFTFIVDDKDAPEFLTKLKNLCDRFKR